MTDREIIDILLNKEVEITNKIHNAVTEVLRFGIDSERGKQVVSDTIESVRYSLEDLESQLLQRL